MTRSRMTLAGAAALATLAGCASYPMPVQRMAAAESAARSASENGAASLPQGQLHLRLAQEEIAQAKALLQNGDNKRADFTLVRANADADLALGEAREQQTEAEAQKALQAIAALSAGATPAGTSITTTTSGTTAAPPPTSTTTTTPGAKP